jgi:predicted nucleic acid-binding protein
VLSEILRRQPDARVLAWIEAQPATALFTTTLTRAEILYGVGLLPKGRRRDTLRVAVDAVFDEDFAGRVLAFDDPAATLFAEIAVDRKTSGRPISQFDAMIAAVARSRGAALATRNTRDFTYCGIALVDPWAA